MAPIETLNRRFTHSPAPRAVVAWCAALLLCASVHATEYKREAIASAHPLATAAGYAILGKGGNAFDAAVAVAAALAVVEPYSSGLGGGGFWLLHRARDDRQVMLDARETAPAGAQLSQYLDAHGKPLADATLLGGKAAAIPGVPAGLVMLSRKYGRLDLAWSLAPAVRLAREGFPVDRRYARIAKGRERILVRDAAATRSFLIGGRAPDEGSILKQPHLADTLERMARFGQRGFYGGRVAELLVAAVNAAGGAWSVSDLAQYRVLEREPVRFGYRGALIVSASPPSSGGATLAQALNILENFNLLDARGAREAHLVSEALRRGFQDRMLHLGDPDFSTAPLARLVDKNYGRRRAAEIDPLNASVSEHLPVESSVRDRDNTTHYSIIDRWGNRVAATLSINTLFGAGFVASGTGVLLNNEMDDFSLLPGVANNYGLRGTAANALAAGKRPLSSMTPTFVEDEKGVLIVGAPGGSRIISMVLLAILDYVHQPVLDLDRLVAAPRYHHQFSPDRIEIESEGFSPEWHASLARKGHALRLVDSPWGNMQAVFKSRRDGMARAASDPRGRDVAWY